MEHDELGEAQFGFVKRLRVTVGFRYLTDLETDYYMSKNIIKLYLQYNTIAG